MKETISLMKYCFLSFFLFSGLTVKGQALCDTTGCTANDLQVDTVFIAQLQK